MLFTVRWGRTGTCASLTLHPYLSDCLISKVDLRPQGLILLPKRPTALVTCGNSSTLEMKATIFEHPLVSVRVYWMGEGGYVLRNPAMVRSCVRYVAICILRCHEFVLRVVTIFSAPVQTLPGNQNSKFGSLARGPRSAFTSRPSPGYYQHSPFDMSWSVNFVLNNTRRLFGIGTVL